LLDERTSIIGGLMSAFDPEPTWADPTSRVAARPSLMFADPLYCQLLAGAARMQFGQLKRREFIVLLGGVDGGGKTVNVFRCY
jgi:hypothetical protein